MLGRYAMDITEDFIDERFKAFVLEQFCGNRERIQTGDVEGIISLRLANQGFSSLKGIEHFVSLEKLDCSSNHLTELNISKNTYLKTLDCRGNKLNTLDTVHNTNLEKLSCNKNEIHSLDLTANVKLEALDCGFNRLRQLDVRRNPKLAKLVCYWNILSELHLEQNVNLKELNCSYNSMFGLELDQNTQLTHLDCENNYLIGLNINNCGNLVEIRCNNNHLRNLNVTGSPALESLRCFNNHLTNLDLGHNPILTELYCSENKLTELETRHNPKLQHLSYADNLIAEPDHAIKGMGTFRYDNSLSCYKTILHYKGKELSVTADVPAKADMKRLSTVIRKAWERIDELHGQAIGLIARTHPDEDVSELVFSELEFHEDGTIRFGYDAGDTPAGQLYIYAVFNRKLDLNSQLVYETY